MTTANETTSNTLPVDDGRPESGVIHAANEARFTAAHYSEPLTAFTVGWRDPENLEALLDFISPPVPVGRRFEFKRGDNAEAFYSETDDVRAIGSAFKRVEYAGESVNEKTLNKGLTIRVDHDEIVGEDWQERYVQLLLQRLYRNELRRAVAALDTAAGSATNETWDSSSNPDAAVRDALIAAADASGVRPNRIVFGEGAWAMRSAAYDSQQNAAAFRYAGLSPDELAPKLLVDGVRVISARYQSAPAAKTAVVGDAVYTFYAEPAIAKDEPSNLKRFVTPVDGGGNFRVFLEETAKYTDLTVEHYSSIVATSTLGVQKLAVADA